MGRGASDVVFGELGVELELAVEVLRLVEKHPPPLLAAAGRRRRRRASGGDVEVGHRAEADGVDAERRAACRRQRPRHRCPHRLACRTDRPAWQNVSGPEADTPGGRARRGPALRSLCGKFHCPSGPLTRRKSRRASFRRRDLRLLVSVRRSSIRRCCPRRGAALRAGDGDSLSVICFVGLRRPRRYDQLDLIFVILLRPLYAFIVPLFGHRQANSIFLPLLQLQHGQFPDAEERRHKNK